MSTDQPGAGSRILAELAIIKADIAEIKAMFKGGFTPPYGATTPASDADLDGQYGNPEVKKDPPRWKGDSFLGKPFNQCPPEYLDEMAGFQLWVASKEDAKAATITDEAEKKKAEKNAWYGRQRAGYARGWAARLRAGWKPPEEPKPDW